MSKNSEKTLALYQKYIMPTYAPQMLFERGQGSKLWDTDGVCYLDFACGISVCNLGHAHPAVTKAVSEQVSKLVHVSNLYYNEVTPKLAEKLVTGGMDGVVFFCNSGAEANEGMIKFARKFGSAQGKFEIITMEDSFHGRTLATLAATGRAKYRKGFAPDVPGFKQVPYNDIEALKGAITDKTIAIMLEPVQGEGGIIPATPQYMQEVRDLCDQKGLLMLLDEVQCGMGRTGKLFAYQNFGIEPDAASMAKAIANGLPMGAFIVKRKHQHVLKPGEHASTFGGNLVVSAAALAVLQTIEDENLLDNTIKMGKYLKSELERISKPYSFVQGVRGLGLMIGLVLDRDAGPLRKMALEHGLVTLTAGENVLRLLPALNITQQEADAAIKSIALGLADFAKTC